MNRCSAAPTPVSAATSRSKLALARTSCTATTRARMPFDFDDARQLLVLERAGGVDLAPVHPGDPVDGAGELQLGGRSLQHLRNHGRFGHAAKVIVVGVGPRRGDHCHGYVVALVLVVGRGTIREGL